MARLTVIVAGPWKDSGGMGSYLNSIRGAEAREVSVHEVSTWTPGSRIKQLLVFVRGAGQILALLLKYRSNQVLVHLHASTGGSLWRKVLLAKIARSAGGWVMWQFHGGRLIDGKMSAYTKRFIAREVSRAPGVAAVSKGLADEVACFFNLDRSTIRVLPPGVPDSFFRPEPVDQSGEIPRSIVFVGKWEHNKGVDLLVDALSFLPADLDWKLTIYGRITDPRHLVESIHRFEAGRIVDGGVLNRDELPDILRDHDVLVLPSRRESFGIVLVEAIAVGIPWIASDASGPKEIYESVGGGLIFRAGDPEDLSMALLEALSGKLSVSVESRRRAHDLFSVGSFQDRIVSSWADVVSGE